MTPSDPHPPMPLEPPPAATTALALGAPSTPFSLGFPPIDHEPPGVDDVAQRTNQRSIIAHIFTTLVAGGYLLLRVEVEVNHVSDAGASGVPFAWVLGAIVPFIILRFLLEVLRWRAFTYRVNSHRLVIDKGILTRHHVVVPFDRVQQVDINRRFTALLLGLAAVRIDTAGMGGHTSVQLRYLDPQAANGLRAFILSHRDERRADAQSRGADPAGAVVLPAPPEQTLVTLGPKRLVVASLTHHSLLVALPVLLGLAVWIAAVISLLSDQPVHAAFAGFGGVVLASLTIILVVQSVIGTVVRHWGFTLSHTGDDLHLRFGLTDQRHLTVPRRRIQRVEVIDNPLRRALGLVTVHLHSAASLSGAGPGRAGTRFEIPVLRRAELAIVLPLIIGDPHFHIPGLTPRPTAARHRAMLRRVGLLALAVSVPAIAARPAGFALVPLVLLGVPWGAAAHRRAGHARTPAVAVVGHGVLQHRVVLIPRHRLQSARTSASPFQRRVHLRTIHLDVARAVRAPSLFDMDEDVAAAWRSTVPMSDPAVHDPPPDDPAVYDPPPDAAAMNAPEQVPVDPA